MADDVTMARWREHAKEGFVTRGSSLPPMRRIEWETFGSGWVGKVGGLTMFDVHYGIGRGEGYVLASRLPWYKKKTGFADDGPAKDYAEKVLAHFLQRIGARI